MASEKKLIKGHAILDSSLRIFLSQGIIDSWLFKLR